jgi:hypothetical protein
LKGGLALTLGSHKKGYYLVFQPSLEERIGFNPWILKGRSVLMLKSHKKGYYLVFQPSLKWIIGFIPWPKKRIGAYLMKKKMSLSNQTYALNCRNNI